jgi:hypothetical protein
MRTMSYFPCKVCKSETGKVILPDADVDPQSGEILSIECKPFEEVHKDLLQEMKIKDQTKFDNCEATIFENKQIMCFKCGEGFYYDGVHQVCRETKKFPGMEGCALTFDNSHCVFCNSDLQMDITNGKCISKDAQIDFNSFGDNQSPGASSMNELSANSNSIARENNVFTSSNNFADESGSSQFDSGDQSYNEYRYL